MSDENIDDMMTSGFSHLDAHGRVHMVDVTNKDNSSRRAIARCYVLVSPETLNMIQRGDNRKGDILTVARIAGISAAKNTAMIIPLCHTIPLSSIVIDIDLDIEKSMIVIHAAAKTWAKTGVEMEAMTAVSITALTIYDMCKAVDRSMTITGVRLLEKEGGQSGSWRAPSDSSGMT